MDRWWFCRRILERQLRFTALCKGSRFLYLCAATQSERPNLFGGQKLRRFTDKDR